MASKEIPEWLKRYYLRLWDKYGHDAFTFNNATDVLGVGKGMAVKTLWELEQRGFLSKSRSEIDYRSKQYRLISPDDVNFVVGFFSLVEKEKLRSKKVIDRLVLLGDKLQYAVTGSYAAYYYHGYINPPKMIELKVDSADVGKWIALLTDEDTKVFVGSVFEARKIRNYVKLVPSFLPLEDIRVKTREGFYVEKIEPLTIEMLQRQAQISVAEAAAMIITHKNKIRWAELIKLAKSANLKRQLGCMLDIINTDAEKPVIRADIVGRLKAAGATNEMFPRDELFLARQEELRDKLAHQALFSEKEKKEFAAATKRFEAYGELSKKWGIRIILPKEVIKKVLTDLGVKIGKE